VIGTAEANLLESGGSITIGTVDADGMPDASRGWLIRVAPGGARLRCFVPGHEDGMLDDLATVGRIAINWVHVHTMESIQVKGRVTAIEAPTEEDLVASAAYREAFFAMLQESDGTPRHLLERLVPARFVAVEVEVDEQYDQTPGPNAGERR
jgi:hypothetical protein